MEPNMPESTQIVVPQEPRPVENSLDVKQKELLAQKKKRRFKILAIVLGLILIISILIPVGIGIYDKYFKKNPVVLVPPEHTTPEIGEIITKNTIQHDTAELSLTLEYLEDAFLNEEASNGIKKLSISYVPNTSEPGVVLEKDLVEGYIFKISTFSTEVRDLEEISVVKKDAFISTCPETAQVSKIEQSDIGTAKAVTFSVSGCNGDYNFTYLFKFDKFYELEQFYKGDFGYKQRYRAATEDILRSINFYPENPIVEGEYKNDEYKFSFKHPNLSYDCCKVSSPGIGNVQNIVSLGDPASKTDEQNFDGFAVFYPLTLNQSFDSYVEEQKKTLIDDYVVVLGKAPNPEVIEIKVGSKRGVVLKDYSWRKNNLIIVDVGGDPKSKIMIISIMNASGESFDEKASEMLRSFEYF